MSIPSNTTLTKTHWQNFCLKQSFLSLMIEPNFKAQSIPDELNLWTDSDEFKTVRRYFKSTMLPKPYATLGARFSNHKSKSIKKITSISLSVHTLERLKAFASHRAILGNDINYDLVLEYLIDPDLHDKTAQRATAEELIPSAG
jgi:hypothetical protein